MLVKTLQTEEEMTCVLRFFGASSNPTRLKILFISETKRPLHIKAVAKALKMGYAAVYRNVGVLKKANLLEVFEVGRSRVLFSTSHGFGEAVYSTCEESDLAF